jgi:hypothetical protein
MRFVDEIGDRQASRNLWQDFIPARIHGWMRQSVV